MKSRERRSAFGTGVRFGLGFSIPFVILYALVFCITNIGEKLILDRLAVRSERKPFGPEAKLEILHQEAARTEQNLFVRGRIKNRGGDIWDFIQLEADLIDAGGKLTKMCRGRVVGPLHPGEERFFEIDCEGSKDEPLPAYARYELKVADANCRTRDGG